MQSRVLIVSDDAKRSGKLADLVGRRFRWEVVAPDEMANLAPGAISLLIVDVDLSDIAKVDVLKAGLTALSRSRPPSIFMLSSPDYAEKLQANALGATNVLAPPYKPERLNACIDTLVPPVREGEWAERPEAEQQALQETTKLNDSIQCAVETGAPLPKDEIIRCGSLVAESLKECGLASWLQAVKQHHSYTHRHCLSVSGLATAFALDLGMAPADVKRVAVSALLHDVGKARVPLSTLDKPTELTEVERDELHRHTIYGAEIILADEQFDPEVVDVVRHHHEYLDGSGYPDGLDEDTLSDLVRLVTVVDVYSALIDCRAYKDSMSSQAAIEVMKTMDGKIDMDILQAFEPTALHGASSVNEGLARKTARP